MKKLIFLLLGSPIITIAQDKIEGIGPFKINKSDTSIVYDYAKNNAKKIEGVFTWGVQIRQDNTLIYRLGRDSINNIDMPSINYSYCPDVVVYNIPVCVIADITIKNIFLSFYKNKLINIKSDCNYSLTEALETKYGKPNIYKSEGSTEVTSSGTKAVIEMPTSTYFSSWENGDIKATAVLSDGFDKNGVREIMQYFNIEDPLAYNVSKYCDEDIRAEIKKKKKDAELKKLSSL